MQIDIHYHFAEFFPQQAIRPYAYLLSKRLSEGHICIPVSHQEETPFQYPSAADIKKLSKQILGSAENTNAPFIADEGFIYLQRYYKYEINIYQKLIQKIMLSVEEKHILRKQLASVQEELDSFVKDGSSGTKEPDWQMMAIIRCLLQRFAIISGGPGTGKTTTLARLLGMLYAIDRESRIALAAPTGKASMRMIESLRQRVAEFPERIREKIETLKPHTLHALLGYQKNSIYFKHNIENPLPYDCIIIDEASMIDVPMFSKLLDACSLHTRLILLGDKDQLASVEAGSLLGDLCVSAGTLNTFNEEDFSFINKIIAKRSSPIPDSCKVKITKPLANAITELRHSHRFGKDSQIGNLSRAIIQGDIDAAVEIFNNQTQQEVSMIDFNDQKRFRNFILGYADYLQEDNISIALKKFNKLKILVSVREGNFGLYAINIKIEQILSAAYPGLIKPAGGFYHNQPVMITQNNYELGLYNGDIGIVRKDSNTNRLRVWFASAEENESVRSFNPAHFSSYETAFAMTIHKSQGSEFDQVMVVLPEKTDNLLLSRELLYTGITRAKSSALLMGTEEALRFGIHRSVERFSGLQKRFSAQ
jgi:exodeoxyribonuclease V alpha subunit